MKRRIISIITALALCLSLCPAWAFAAEADPALCKHHPEHTEDCGYIAPTEGRDCGHEHTEDCYTLGVLPDADGSNPYEVGADTENLLDCHHSHDSECGYAQADPGQPCGYECRICPIEDLIAALPDKVTEDNAADVRVQLDEILALFSVLTEDEQEQIDLSRVYELQGALDGANDPAPITESVEYQEASWDGSQVTYESKTETCTLVENSAEAVTWTAGWYAVSGTVTIDQPITVSGAVNLILTDGCDLTAAKGIVVTDGNSLTIYAQSKNGGTLNATGTTDDSGNASAGIGGSTSSVDSGSITIHGGIINATGGVANNNFGNPNYGGAGIGGSTASFGNGGNSGTIEIYGGTITANSGEGSSTGAGIGGGGGGNGKNGGDGSGITIYGGNVTAASHGTQSGGAGIGGGEGDIGDGGAGNNIQINGGMVHATGGYLGAGIGGGGGTGRKSGDGTVTISGGTVTAVGGSCAAGIGGGGGYQYSNQWASDSTTGGTGSVTITGGIVDASSPTDVDWEGYEGAPIGNGGNASGTATVNKTTGIVFENGVGTVCGDVTLDGSYTVPGDYTLNIPLGASLSGSGTLSGGNAFTTENLTADMISVPTDLYYDGKDRTTDITTELSGELDKGITICGQTFTVRGWTLAVAKTDDLHYTATLTQKEWYKMGIWVTGDTHGDFHRFTTKNFPHLKGMSRDDCMIIAGDFGGVWAGEQVDGHKLDWLEDKPFTTLFVDGNHENFSLLNSYPEREWHGGRVHAVRPHVLHLLRGQIFEIGGLTWFTMGGAASHDIQDGILDPAASDFERRYWAMRRMNAMFRVLGHSWWPEEMPSETEYAEAEANLERSGWQVDCVLSHCAPSGILPKIDRGYDPDALTDFLETVRQRCRFSFWFLGHYHTNQVIDQRYVLQWERISKIE